MALLGGFILIMTVAYPDCSFFSPLYWALLSFTSSGKMCYVNKSWCWFEGPSSLKTEIQGIQFKNADWSVEKQAVVRVQKTLIFLAIIHNQNIHPDNQSRTVVFSTRLFKLLAWLSWENKLKYIGLYPVSPFKTQSWPVPFTMVWPCWWSKGTTFLFH